MTSPGYLRFPHLHDDVLTFVAEDDVWLAPAAGGRAWRLSADRTEASYPRISPDGRLIAWTGLRDGQPEIYLAEADGGIGRRLTYWGDGGTRLCGWTPAGEIVAVTSAGQAFRHLTWAFAVPAGQDPATGPRRLPFGPVSDVAVTADAVALLNGALGRDPAWWKRYRGGTSGRLWVRPAGLGAPGTPGGPADLAGPGTAAGGTPFRRLLAGLPGQFYSPMLIGGRLAFLSDHEGTGNVYSCTLDGTDLRRHTDHDGFYARNASTDGRRVVYHCAGDIWLLADLDPATRPARLEVSLGSAGPARAPRPVSAADHLGALSCDPSGRASAIEVRGTVHWLTHRDGPARALSVVPGSRARLPRVLGRTGQVIWVTDAEGADALEIGIGDPAGTGNGAAPATVAVAQPPRRLAAGAGGQVSDLAAAPDGGTVAVAAHDGRLLLVDIASGAVTELAASDNGEITGLAWSPDSAWLAWSEPGPSPLRRLRLARLAGRSVTDVTDGRFTDTDPVFTKDGRYLAFLSRRNFDPVYDAHVFDLSFPYGCRPYLVPLAAATPSPFGPLTEGRPPGHDADAEAEDTDGQGSKHRLAGAGDASAGDTGAGGTGAGDGAAGSADAGSADVADRSAKAGGGGRPDHAVPPVVVDLAGLAARVVPVPVPESRYSSLRAVRSGLAWLREPLTGNLGQGGAQSEDEPPRAALECFDLGRRRCTEVAGEADWFEVSGDGRWLVIRDEDELAVVPAAQKDDSDDDRIRVDLARARFQADPAALWRCAYAEAGRIIRNDFWVPDLAGVDWDRVLADYGPLLDRIAGSSDFADLLWETVGELGSSHAYVSTHRPDGAARSGRIGLLGADLERDGDGAWRVSRIVPGDSSDPRARSPLAAPGAEVGPGDALLTVDGQPLDPAAGPGPLLAGAAGKPVELTIAPAAGPPRRAVVVPLGDERRLRYLDWVASRRQLVRDLGEGRIGYLHVPDMMSQGWADFHRDLNAEMQFDALICDVRGNSGGHTSQLVVEKLARRVIAWEMPRWLRPITYPQDAPRGPVVAVTDECAGSDGDIVTAAIRTLGLGPVVGTRTWGGVIGIDGWHELVDGTQVTVPRYSFWFTQYGWGVENYGVDPDVEVVITPDDWAAGRDVQLETAVRLAAEALAASPPAGPPSTAARPSRQRPPLPPRQPA